jgi:hypothetical protein
LVRPITADYGVGDGEGGCANCSDTSGVAVGEGIAGDGDAVGESSFSEEGACTNESRELLIALGLGVAVGFGVSAAFVVAGFGFRGVAST